MFRNAHDENFFAPTVVAADEYKGRLRQMEQLCKVGKQGLIGLALQRGSSQTQLEGLAVETSQGGTARPRLDMERED